MTAIVDVHGREVLDSRGFPTVEVEVYLEDGCMGRAIVPSGASTGMFEAYERRDDDKERYLGKGVLKAVQAVNEDINDYLSSYDAADQQAIDQQLITLDGSANKNNLGANAILGVSMAVARAAACSFEMPLYQWLGGRFANLLPTPFMNIINGGSHADNKLDIQEFMIVPHGAASFSEALQMGAEVFHTLKSILKQQGLSTNVGDEGGFAPNCQDTRQALDLVLSAIHQAGYSPDTIGIALDVAASELWQQDTYQWHGADQQYNAASLVSFYSQLVKEYPIVSIEDGMAEEDWSGWALLTQELGHKIQLVGDDVFVTNTQRLQQGIDQKVANAILLKMNQIGTVSETMATIHLAQQHHYGLMVSHRSGETEDCFIADLSVASRSGQIKTGSLSRTDRLAKYNQLLRIEEELGVAAQYAGTKFMRGYQPISAS